MTVTSAWLLTKPEQCHILAGAYEVVETINIPTLFTIPNTPSYCQYMTLWRAHPIPVIALHYLINPSMKLVEKYEYMVIVTWIDSQNQQQKYGGLLLSERPMLTSVKDEDSINPPSNFNKLKTLITGCVEHQNKIALILDFEKLFTTSYQILI